MDESAVLTHGSLFAGIGGFDLGFERAGIKTIWQVEIDPYCQCVLAKHFQSAVRHRDIRTCGKHNLTPVDIISGGFPCQPISCAGRRKGDADIRWLWPEMLRVVACVRPAWVVAENTDDLLSYQAGRLIDEIYAQLEAENYETLPPFVLPASALAKGHERYRAWIIAHSKSEQVGPVGQPWQYRGMGGTLSYASIAGMEEQRLSTEGQICVADAYRDSEGRVLCDTPGSRFPYRPEEAMERPTAFTEFERPSGREIERDFRGVAYGVSNRVDRLKALGNSIVPQIAEWIGRRIVKCAA